MITDEETSCSACGGDLKYYDSVPRLVRTKGRETCSIRIRRLRCLNCGGIHRELPAFIFPYKQYETEIISGVQEGLITSDTFGYEDYPCETTMVRWRTQKLQTLL